MAAGATFPGGPGDTFPGGPGDTVTQPAPSMAQQFFTYWRAGHCLQTNLSALNTRGKELFTHMNTFHTQIRPEIQISSFEFNQSLPEMQLEVSVPSYFQVKANRPM